MMTSRESLKDTLGSIFDRKGGGGAFMRRYEAFTSTEQQDLLDGLTLEETEMPVVAAKMPDGCRVLITTDRILQFESDAWLAIAVSEITDVAPSKFGTVKKAEMECLVLKTKSDGDKYLKTEPGKPHFGVWNMLLNLVARNRAARA